MAKLTGFRSGVLFLVLVIVTGCTFEVVEDTNMARKSPTGITGWAQSGELFTGRGVDPHGGKAVVMQAELDKDDSLTTQFNLESRGFANCRAEITSSVNGNTVRRLITVVDGATITTRGKNITVRARDHTAGGISSGEKYVVSILATLGVRAGFKQPPFLTPLEYTVIGPVPAPATAIVAGIPVAAATGEVEITVPEDAGIISLLVTVGTSIVLANNTFLVEQRLGSVVMQTYDPRDWDWVPLAPGVNIIRLTNTSAAEVTAFIFFGIDG